MENYPSELAKAVVEDLQAFVEALTIYKDDTPHSVLHKLKNDVAMSIDDLVKGILFAPIDRFRVN